MFLRQLERNTTTMLGKTLVPWSEFGRKYLEHYGYGSARNKAQYERERKFFKEKGVCPWEVEK